MIKTVQSYSVVASKLCSKVVNSQLLKTNVDTWGDFKLHTINNPEFAWIERHASNHLCFLEVLHARQLKAHLDYDPLCIVPIHESIRLVHDLDAAMQKLNVDRVARTILVKKRFQGIQAGSELLSHDGFTVTATERRNNGEWIFIYIFKQMSSLI